MKHSTDTGSCPSQEKAQPFIECDWCDGHGAFNRDYSRSAWPSDNGANVCSRCSGTGKVKNPDYSAALAQKEGK